MTKYTPTVDEVRDRYADGLTGIGEWTRFDESVKRAVESAYAEFDRMIAEVRREAAEKAWDRCVGEMPIDPDWKNLYSDNNPYRAEAYRQERGEER